MRAPLLSSSCLLLLVTAAACGGGSDTTTDTQGGGAGTSSGKGGASAGAAGASGKGASGAGNAGASGKGASSAGNAGASGVAGASGQAGKAGNAGATGGAAGKAGAAGATGGQAGAGGCACTPQEVCAGTKCIPKVPCGDGDGCSNDQKCDPVTKVCMPWDLDPGGFDPGCIHVTDPGVLSPKIGCEFTTPPPGDPFPMHVDVQGSPIVVPFDAGKEILAPVIVASFTYTVINNYTEEEGVLRVLDGGTCALDANLTGKDLDGDGVVDFTVSSSTPAAADLDGDGVPEIVAYGSDGALLAFKKTAGVWGLLWKSAKVAAFACTPANHRCPTGWAGPSIYDLDDDGKPEIVREGYVYSATGALLSPNPPSYASYNQGLFGVVADIDDDPGVELVNGAHAWEWKNGAWVEEAYFKPNDGPGHVAVANFGSYGAGLAASAPEIVVCRQGVITIHDRFGAAIFGPTTIPGMGTGGPPTVADFDGDGLPEVGVASKGAYTVFDIDCTATPRPGGKCDNPKCDGGPCPVGVLWSRTTQDISSSVTGSSVFDFEGDGEAEVVYGDECFTRVYDGRSGEVVFSQYRSSCTWYENPIIADTDGNYRADLVVPSNKACSPDGLGKPCTTLNADGVDPQFNGLRCKTAKDCASGTCDAGLCRCTASAGCCAKGTDAACIEEGYKCAPPEAGTAGTGNTCRAAHPHGVSGIRVYRDANDQWVRSRPIWNQHAYAVTHVSDLGVVPSTSQWKKNWLDPDLNNFRQNVPGKANPKAVPDLTADGATGFSCTGSGVAKLSAEVCNRGATDVAAGVVATFSSGGGQVCTAKTTAPLAPGKCETVSCSWAAAPKAGKTDVGVQADLGKQITECFDGNNTTIVAGVVCP